jgi:hypothetical protein
LDRELKKKSEYGSISIKKDLGEAIQALYNKKIPYEEKNLQNAFKSLSNMAIEVVMSIFDTYEVKLTDWINQIIVMVRTSLPLIANTAKKTIDAIVQIVEKLETTLSVLAKTLGVIGSVAISPVGTSGAAGGLMAMAGWYGMSKLGLDLKKDLDLTSKSMATLGTTAKSSFAAMAGGFNTVGGVLKSLLPSIGGGLVAGWAALGTKLAGAFSGALAFALRASIYGAIFWLVMEGIEWVWKNSQSLIDKLSTQSGRDLEKAKSQVQYFEDQIQSIKPGEKTSEAGYDIDYLNKAKDHWTKQVQQLQSDLKPITQKASEEITAMLIRVIDGDTISVKMKGSDVPKIIRLAYVDTLECVHSDFTRNNIFGKFQSEILSNLMIIYTVYSKLQSFLLNL